LSIQPVPSHVFILVFLLSCYLGWAAFGILLTGEYPFFWLNKEEVESTEAVAAYSSAFVSMGPAGEWHTI